MFFLLFSGSLAAGPGLVEAGAVLGFDFGGIMDGFAPEVYRVLVASVLLGLLSVYKRTDLDPE